MYNKIRFDTFMLMCFFMITILGLSACDSDEKDNTGATFPDIC